MRLRNTTDIPDALVREVIRMVRPSGIKGFDVRVARGRRAYRGLAYWDGSSYHDRACPFVVCKIGTVGWERIQGRFGMREVRIWSRIECLVFLMAHELRHLWQAKVPRGRRYWGSRGRFSERDCDAYALNRLRAWRREKGWGLGR